MSPAATLAGFAVVLAALLGGGAAVGRVLDADAPGGQAEARASAEAPAMQDMTESHTEKKAGDHGAMRMPVRGLAVAENGLRLVVADAELRRDRTERLRFRIVDERGRAMRDFDLEHTKRMHLIVARRDLGTFQHLHPAMRADGTWSTPLRLSDAGSYRVFADFSHDDEATTLASDLRVDGPADLAPLPQPVALAKSDGGLDVRVDRGAARAGRESELRFTVLEHGRPVHVEPYLGADGHLVALREGDLAFLHVHPIGDDHGDDEEGHDDSIGFEATFPTPGSYRLFLQIKRDNRVHTVAFTQDVK